MAWYPDAVRKHFHTAVSNSSSLYGFFNTAASADEI